MGNAILRRPANFIDGGGYADHSTLPGFDARYLTRLPGLNPGRTPKPQLSRICRRVFTRLCGMVFMRPNLLRAPVRGAARSDLLERQFRRYRPQFQGAVRALAARHSRVADLAVSFPALLFALAVPRPGLDPARAIERTIEGVALAEVAAAADVPLWLRKLPPEAFSRPIVKLPDGEIFRRQIANHLPCSPKVAPIWLEAVADIANLAHEAIAVWIAKEIAREKRGINLNRLRLVGLWAWFSSQSDTLGRGMMQKPWTPDMRIGSALDAADDWRTNIALRVNLGREPIADVWLQPGRVAGYDFLPLTSVSDIAEEAAAMRNCLCTYGYNLAHNRSRLWSMRKDDQRVATLKVALGYHDPLLNIVELSAVENAAVSLEVWWAARQWLHMHDLSQVDTKRRGWGTVPLDRVTWISL